MASNAEGLDVRFVERRAAGAQGEAVVDVRAWRASALLAEGAGVEDVAGELAPAGVVVDVAVSFVLAVSLELVPRALAAASRGVGAVGDGASSAGASCSHGG